MYTDFAFILQYVSYTFKIIDELSRYGDAATGWVPVPVRVKVFSFPEESIKAVGSTKPSVQ